MIFRHTHTPMRTVHFCFKHRKAPVRQEIEEVAREKNDEVCIGLSREEKNLF